MRAKVWNDNVHPLNEMFKGEKLTIPAKGYVEMEFFDAHEYKGQYHPIFVDANGHGTPESFKMVRIEKIIEGDTAEDTAAQFTCMSCSKTYESEPVLKAHCETAHAGADKLVIPDEDAQIAKKRGRPAKVA